MHPSIHYSDALGWVWVLARLNHNEHAAGTRCPVARLLHKVSARGRARCPAGDMVLLLGASLLLQLSPASLSQSLLNEDAMKLDMRAELRARVLLIILLSAAFLDCLRNIGETLRPINVEPLRLPRLASMETLGGLNAIMVSVLAAKWLAITTAHTSSMDHQ